LTLTVMFLDRAVDVYDRPHDNLCGDCTRCLGACPTQAFPKPGVVDARRCIAYQSIENRDVVPVPLRKGFAGRMFGCDVCQDVCPFNHDDIPVGDRRFEPRALGLMSPLEIVALTEEQFKQEVAARNALTDKGAAVGTTAAAR